MYYSKRYIVIVLFVLFFSGVSFAQTGNSAIIINHENCNFNQIPNEWINSAKTELHIAYGHTSHGSQLTTGMNGLTAWRGGKLCME